MFNWFSRSLGFNSVSHYLFFLRIHLHNSWATIRCIATRLLKGGRKCSSTVCLPHHSFLNRRCKTSCLTPPCIRAYFNLLVRLPLTLLLLGPCPAKTSWRQTSAWCLFKQYGIDAKGAVTFLTMEAKQHCAMFVLIYRVALCFCFYDAIKTEGGSICYPRV